MSDINIIHTSDNGDQHSVVLYKVGATDAASFDAWWNDNNVLISTALKNLFGAVEHRRKTAQ